MVETIYELKNMLLEEMQKDAQERGIERLDKERVDMVKDLAAAEKDCWEAEYHRGVAEAMEGSGYNGDMMGYNGSSGAQSGSRGSGGRGGSQGGSGRSGWANQYGSGRSRRGYGMGYQEHIDALRMEMQQADPQQREQMMQQLRNMM